MAEEGPPDVDKRTTIRHVAAFGAIGPFAALLRDSEADTAESSRRTAILRYVNAAPGVHFSKIRDDLSLGTGETQYHLQRLVDADALHSERDGEYRRYYPVGVFDQTDRQALAYLRRRTPRGIIRTLLAAPDTAPSELAEALDVSRGAISQSASGLESAGLLTRSGGTYQLTEPERLLTLLVRYANSFDEETIAFADRASGYLRWDPEGITQ